MGAERTTAVGEGIIARRRTPSLTITSFPTMLEEKFLPLLTTTAPRQSQLKSILPPLLPRPHRNVNEMTGMMLNQIPLKLVSNQFSIFQDDVYVMI